MLEGKFRRFGSAAVHAFLEARRAYPFHPPAAFAQNLPPRGRKFRELYPIRGGKYAAAGKEEKKP
jgi:hypothetical protein